MLTMVQLFSQAVQGRTDYVQPTRNFSLTYIILDSLFIVVFLCLLWIKKKKVCFLWALFGGVLYWIVDWGLFYFASHSREIYFYCYDNAKTLCNWWQTGFVLFWMSMSYGILDFAFIWLWLEKDKHALEWSALIVIWWICCPLMTNFMNNLIPNTLYFQTTRGTGKYHGIMGLIMVIGYAIVLLRNIFEKDKERIPILRLFIIGFMAQFLWEFLLFVFGIRSQNYESDPVRIITTMLSDSLVETNLGLPYIYFIQKAVSKKWNEDLTRVELVNSND